MTPVGICVVIPHSETAHWQSRAYFFVLFHHFETGEQTSDVICHLVTKRSVNYWDLPDFVKYYLAAEVFLTAMRSISIITDLSISSR